MRKNILKKIFKKRISHENKVKITDLNLSLFNKDNCESSIKFGLDKKLEIFF